MPDQRVFVNTEDKGVLYIDLKELAADKERLEPSDLKTLEIRIDQGFSVSMIVIWPPWEVPVIIS